VVGDRQAENDDAGFIQREAVEPNHAAVVQILLEVDVEAMAHDVPPVQRDREFAGHPLGIRAGATPQAEERQLLDQQRVTRGLHIVQQSEGRNPISISVRDDAFGDEACLGANHRVILR